MSCGGTRYVVEGMDAHGLYTLYGVGEFNENVITDITDHTVVYLPEGTNLILDGFPSAVSDMSMRLYQPRREDPAPLVTTNYVWDEDLYEDGPPPRNPLGAYQQSRVKRKDRWPQYKGKRRHA